MHKTVINSLPKAGTHLLEKCLDLLGYTRIDHIGPAKVRSRTIDSIIRRLLWLPVMNQGYIVGIDYPTEVSKKPINKMLSNAHSGEYFTSHQGYTTDFLSKLIQLDFFPIVIVRDPRAVLASFVPYVIKNNKHMMHKIFREIDVEKRYLATLKGLQNDKISLQPLRIRCNAIDPWILSDRVLLVKFEDLVGGKGGGSDITQKETICRICDWLKIPKDRIENTANNLFGGQKSTFRTGRVNSWKEEIPPDVQVKAKIELKDILKKWGYS